METHNLKKDQKPGRSENIVHFLKGFSISFFTTIAAIIIIRIFELYYIHTRGFSVIEPDVFFSGINFDMFFQGLLNMILFVPLITLAAFFPKLSIVIYRTICLFIIFVTLCLTHFFLTNNFLLSNEILFFSLEDIFTIISSELSFNRLLLWSFYVLIPIAGAFQFYFFKKYKVGRVFTTITLIVFGLISLSILVNLKNYYKDVSHFTTRFNYYLGNNKITYLSSSIYNYFEAEDESDANREGIEMDIDEFHNLNKLKYTSVEYPLLRVDNIENALGPYFNPSDKKPNIVLIISESLSSSFSGKYANLVNLTPFVDSLMNEGLYWKNFISNAERSYGALPNILASLPNGGHRGFVNLFENGSYPNHNSLIKILKGNGYSTSFYYGGWAYYEHMGDFLTYNGIDNIFSDNTFDKYKYDYTNGGHDKVYWGYNDKNLFGHVFEKMDIQPKNKPYFNIITTISLHTPYNTCTKNYYNIDYISKRLKNLNLDIEDVIANFKQVPKSQIDSYKLEQEFKDKLGINVLASIFFIDDAMREFFSQYKKRADYNNTIFIITGDHNIGTLPLKNELDNYRVPLIIYSPLLKQHKEFKAVSSHIDVLPSLLALLNKQYQLRVPLTCHWMGLGLDTVGFYRNRNAYSLSLFSQNFPNFLYKDYLVSSKKVYHVKENLELEVSNNTRMNDSVLKIMKNYKIINNYVCSKNKISYKDFK